MSLFLNTSSLHNHYLDCCTLDVSETIERDCLSVLHKLHDQVNGLQLVQVVVQPLAGLLLSASTSTYMMSPDTAQAMIARLDTDRDVNWLMEIIGYGLSMPFSLTGDQDSVKDCCTIYCEWLASALLPYNEHNEDSKYQQLSKMVPVPIKKDPNRYARKMLSHLYNVFLPRQTSISLGSNPTSSSSIVTTQKDQADAQLATVSRQAVLCHRVLRTIENIAQNPSNLMDNQTWDHLLALLLTVNDKLLSAPTQPDDIGTQLHDRTLGALFELMLLASVRCIPTASLWKTFHGLSLNWRHRPALVDHWRRITLLLTKRIVQMPSQVNITTQRPDNVDATMPNLDTAQNSANVMLSVNPSAIETAVASMNYENLSQTWYRFLNLIGNPVELSEPNTISRTDEFYHSACSSDNVLDPRQHPCLNVLPQVFMNSMAGLRDFIESFLGTYQQPSEEKSSADLATPDRHPHNQSARGSTVSLASSNLGSLSTVTSQPVSSPQFSHQQQHSQPQAVTPTQARRIKSIAMKGGKVIPFATSTSGSHANALSPPVESAQIHDHPRGGSISSSSRLQQQFMQPRPSLTSLSSRTSQTQQQPVKFKLFADRPKCNSILHVFGDWLFSAALIGSDLNQDIVDAANDGNASEASLGSSSTTTEMSGLRGYSPSPGKKQASQQSKSTVSITSSLGKQQNQSLQHQDSNASTASVPSEKIMLEAPLSADSFESGQAEAMAILCRVFSSKSSLEEISPAYLSRFYLCLQHCLTSGSGQSSSAVNGRPIKRQLLASVLMNSTTLLQKDLDGINLLIPSFIKAIEFVFDCNEKEVPIQPPPRQHNRSGSVRNENTSTTSNSVTDYDLRRACILTLVNLLSYPFHFQNLVIRNCLDETSPTNTFGSLRPRLLKLLFVALQTETDPTNMQVLFGGLSLTIHDLALNAGKPTSSSTNDESLRLRKKNDSSSSANDSANNSLDVSNRQDDTASQSSFVFNSTSGFLVKSLHVTCHLLINIWKHDTQVSLAALELLTTIARVSASSSLIEINDLSESKSALNNNNNNYRIEMRNEHKQTTKWICDYICNQCSRPPPAHSRDMHSTIVAAYQCLSVWFYDHPYLLNEQDCVTTLMEVIELGVSGQKSKTFTFNSSTGATTQSTISKGDKIMKPSSMRVREAAESLLNICMIGARELNGGGNISSYDTVLDEQAIAERFGGVQSRTNLRLGQENEHRQVEIYKLFKYFSDEDSIVFGLFEGPNHDTTTKDAVICLLRTPFGKHCWKMRFNYYTEKSKEKIIANKTLGLIKRPFKQCTTPTSKARMFSFPGGQNKSLYFNNTANFFPESIENLPPNDLDKLVTTLDSYVDDRTRKDTRLKSDLDKINKIFTHQILAEHEVMNECSIRIKRVDCEEPQPFNDLEAARILVTQLGLKSSLNSVLKSDEISPSFIADLKALDHQSVRTFDSVNIFYVRKNRITPREILESVSDRHNVCLDFFEWLIDLGKPTVAKNHRCIIDGMTIHWSDMCQELAFLIPHKISETGPITGGTCGVSAPSIAGCDTSITICWLECSDDMAEVPCETLLVISETGHLLEDSNYPPAESPRAKSRDFAKYFISPMKNGLYRINLSTSFGRQWLALPLVDGMTVSKGILGGLIRESVLNLCRRRRLDADSYQPPHVKRRLKIQEICNSYKISSRYESTEFYNNLFKSKAS